MHSSAAYFLIKICSMPRTKQNHAKPIITVSGRTSEIKVKLNLDIYGNVGYICQHLFINKNLHGNEIVKYFRNCNCYAVQQVVLKSPNKVLQIPQKYLL